MRPAHVADGPAGKPHPRYSQGTLQLRLSGIGLVDILAFGHRHDCIKSSSLSPAAQAGARGNALERPAY